MPELPDIVVYIEALEPRIFGQKLDRVRIASPFQLRTALPPLQAVEGKTVSRTTRDLGIRPCSITAEILRFALHLTVQAFAQNDDVGLFPAPVRGFA